MGHYFDTQPRVASRRRSVELHLTDRTVQLATDRGVFAYGRVDAGTAFLLRRAPAPPREGQLLDLGCGYGPIAISLAIRSPGARVWAVDTNQRALELMRRNASSAGVDNLIATSPDQVPEAVRFVAIYSNPPVRVGLARLHPLLTTWLNRLVAEGVAHLVVQRHLGADSLARWLSAQGLACTRVASHAGYRLLDVQSSPAVPHDG